MTDQEIIDAWNRDYVWGRDFVTIIGEQENGYPAGPDHYEPMNGNKPAFMNPVEGGRFPVIRLHGKADIVPLARVWVVDRWRKQPPRLDEIVYVRRWNRKANDAPNRLSLPFEVWIDRDYVHVRFGDNDKTSKHPAVTWEEKSTFFWQLYEFQPRTP